jgi:hypothetical protein
MAAGTLLNIAYGLDVSSVEDPHFINFEAVTDEIFKAILPGAFLVVSFPPSSLHVRHLVLTRSSSEHPPLPETSPRLVSWCRVQTICAALGRAFKANR